MLSISLLSGAGELAQELRVYAALAEDLICLPAPTGREALTTSCNSSSNGIQPSGFCQHLHSCAQTTTHTQTFLIKNKSFLFVCFKTDSHYVALGWP